MTLHRWWQDAVDYRGNGGLADPLDANAGVLPACCRVRLADDFHSPVSSTRRSPIRSCIGRMRLVAGDAGSRFCSGRRLGTETGLSERVPCRALDSAPGRRFPRRRGRTRDRVLHLRRVEGRAPAARVVPGELEIVALSRHATLDVADPAPRVQPRAERAEHGRIRVHARRFQPAVEYDPTYLRNCLINQKMASTIRMSRSTQNSPMNSIIGHPIMGIDPDIIGPVCCWANARFTKRTRAAPMP